MAARTYHPIRGNETGKVVSIGNPWIAEVYATGKTEEIRSFREAYELAAGAPGTVLSDVPVYRGEQFGLPEGAKAPILEDGADVGTMRPARIDTESRKPDGGALERILHDALDRRMEKNCYHAVCPVRREPDLLLTAHLLLPEGCERLLFGWMQHYLYKYYELREIEGGIESALAEEARADASDTPAEIFIYSDPGWMPEGDSKKDVRDLRGSAFSGLHIFDKASGCAVLLGMPFLADHIDAVRELVMVKTKIAMEDRFSKSQFHLLENHTNAL